MKKSLRTITKRLRFSKRQEFVIATLVLTFGFIILELADPGIHFIILSILTAFSIMVSVVVLRENIRGIRIVTLLLLPAFYTISLGLFYFLIPVRWLTRIPTALVYFIGMYAIYLVENIYGVAVNRSIQLLRVAQAIGFIATLTTLFLLFNTLFSFHLSAVLNMIVVVLLLIPLVFQSLWAIVLSEKAEKELVLFTLCFSLIVSEIACILSFWPLAPVLISLALTTFSYILIGIGQHYFVKRLFRQNVIEFIRVLIIVLVFILLTTQYQ